MGFMLTALLTLIALLVLAALAKLVVELFVRLALGLVLSVGLGVASGIMSAQNGLDGPSVGTVLALIALLPCIVLVWRWRAARQSGGFVGKDLADNFTPDELVTSIEEQLGLADAAALRDAWDNAARIAPGAQLDAPREACAGFLKLATADALSHPEEIELAVLIRKHVPGLIDDTSAVLRLAPESDAEEAIRSMLDELQALGDEAMSALITLREEAEERLSIRKSRLSNRRLEQVEFL